MSTAVRYSGRQGHQQFKTFDDATDADLMVVAPSIFTAERDENRTKAHYQHVNTRALITAMRGEGWAVTMAGQKFARAKTRTADGSSQADPLRSLTARHFVRLRHNSATEHAEYAPEAVFLNAHDGTSRWVAFAGAFRYVCANGLIFGELVNAVKCSHTLKQAGEAGVLAAQLTKDLLKDLPERIKVVEHLKTVELTPAQVQTYAQKALEVRWPQGDSKNRNIPITSNELLAAPHLHEDLGNSAWAVFNHCQRHLVTLAELEGRSALGRRVTTRPVNRVDKLFNVNTGLWTAMLQVAGVRTLDTEAAPKLEPELLPSPKLEPELGGV